ncbi:MAG TPA: prepilin-type N-terminal cleavage/methylation domain-containing protein, partial [bacterium]|nr:prepilin-type N-terminal cleavage/methylation domain-containing protein [bacterium]
MRLRAFTLIELLIVVAIIGILAAIAVPNFMNARIKASVTRAKADLKAATTALEMYRLDNQRYIRTMAGASELWQLTTPMAYMNSVPRDYFMGNQKGKELNPDSTMDTWDYTGSDLGWGGKPPHAYVVGGLGPSKTGGVSQLDWAWNGPNKWDPKFFRDG